jgi:hypothetical protein
VWLALLGTCALSRPAVAQVDLPTRIDEVRRAVATVLVYGRDGSELRQGTGFFVEPNGLLITNWHVLQGAYRAEARMSSSVSYPIEGVVAGDEFADLVMARVGSPRVRRATLRLATTTPRVGESVFVVGTPVGLEATVTNGIVSAFRTLPGTGSLIQMTAPISPGSSGSPVLNEQGEVVGVATLRRIDGQSLNFAVPAARVAALRPGPPTPLASWSAPTPSASRSPAAQPESVPTVVLREVRVRLVAPTANVARMTGTALGVRGDALLFRPDQPAVELVLPLSSIESLELSRGRKDLGVLGGVVGVLALGAFGAKLGWDNTLGIDCQPGPNGEEGLCEATPRERAAQGFLIAGFVGGWGGWALGAKIGWERWEAMPVQMLRR